MAALPLPLLATASEGLAVWQPGVDAPLVDSLPHDAPVSCLRWTTDDRVLASTSADGCVVLTRLEREAVDRLQVAPSGSGVAVLSLTWSPGSRYLATGASDAAIRVFDLRKGVQALTLRGHRAAVRSISWSPSEVYVASSSDSGDILVHRVQGSVAVVARLEHPLYATRISATAPPPVGYVQWATFQPSLLAAGADDGTVTIWDVVPSASVLAPLHAFNEHSDACTGVQWSPVNQHLLVSASTDGWLVFYDVTKRARLREIQVVEPITAFSLSHDSLFIACGTETGKLRLFDLRVTRDSAVWTVQAHDGPLSCVSFQRLGMRPPAARGGGTPSAPPQHSTPDSRAHRPPPPPEASGRSTPPPSLPTPAAERATVAVATPASAVAARCKPPRQTEQPGAEAEGGASTGAAASADGALPRWLPSRLTGRMGDACLDERSPTASWDASSTHSTPDAGAAAEASGGGGGPSARLAPRKAWHAELDYDCPSSGSLPQRAGSACAALSSPPAASGDTPAPPPRAPAPAPRVFAGDVKQTDGPAVAEASHHQRPTTPPPRAPAPATSVAAEHANGDDRPTETATPAPVGACSSVASVALPPFSVPVSDVTTALDGWMLDLQGMIRDELRGLHLELIREMEHHVCASGKIDVSRGNMMLHLLIKHRYEMRAMLEEGRAESATLRAEVERLREENARLKGPLGLGVLGS